MDDTYRERSYGEVPIGFGDKPGVVVVDFQVGFTDARYPASTRDSMRPW